MAKNGWVFPFLLFSFFFSVGSSYRRALASKDGCRFSLGPLMVTREQRKTVAWTESGRISTVRVDDGYRGPYHLQFITLEPNSLFLPVLLHMDMVFYVHTGRGSVGWAGEDDMNRIDVERGDIFRLGAGSIFHVRSHLEPPRERLRIYALFDTMSNENAQPEMTLGPYSNLSDLVRGFDDEVLQRGFAVSEEMIQPIKWSAKPPPIVHFAPNHSERYQLKGRDILDALIEGSSSYGFLRGNKKKKMKTFNILEEKPDVDNCNGWSIAVTNKDFKGLKGSNVGVFMVNLTRGAMMAPHWNPMATEIAIVTHGQGMVQVVFPTVEDDSTSRSVRFKVEEGDVFVVPRYHPMAQMSFNNDSLVFVGFSTYARGNHPQFLVGKRSVMQALDRKILAISLNVTNATAVDELIAKQQESVILECASCAEEEERIMEEEIERKRQEEEEEAGKRQEEERRRQEERRRREEEEERRRGEERRKREEEERRVEEEARKREEEEEEARKREEEERERRREEERQREEEEEEERRWREAEEERWEREQEEAEEKEWRRKQEEEDEEARRREVGEAFSVRKMLVA